MIIGEPKHFTYDYTDMYKLDTTNRKLVRHMLNNQIKLIEEYGNVKLAEKYILFKEFLDWLEEKQIGHTLSFKEEILSDELTCSEFNLTFYLKHNRDSIVNHIDKDRLSKLHIYSYTRE